MGLFSKIKDILFEEEEAEEKEVTKKEEKKEAKVAEPIKPIAEKIEPQKRVDRVAEAYPREPSRSSISNSNNSSVAVENTKSSYNTVNERELFKSDNTSPFLDFDEEEFSSSFSRQTQKQKPTTNVLEYEKKKKIEKKYDYGRYERTETREVVEKKKFKPSPIISPVYGILNEDYKIEDIKDKTEEYANNNLDFNSVRKKAFGDIEILDEQSKETFYEETVTVKLKENAEDKKQKVKTIDELLEDTADVEINLDKKPQAKEEVIKENPISDYEKVDEDLEEIIDNNKKDNSPKLEDDDDTLENDLFDLIDSMYDNREDGDY